MSAPAPAAKPASKHTPPPNYKCVLSLKGHTKAISWKVFIFEITFVRSILLRISFNLKNTELKHSKALNSPKMDCGSHLQVLIAQLESGMRYDSQDSYKGPNHPLVRRKYRSGYCRT